MPEIFTCPVCKNILRRKEKTYVCPLGHSYDISAKRYVNLLTSADGAVHGDNRKMIADRHCFLKAGFYSHLLDTVSTLSVQAFPPCGVLLDAGCGEGYYTNGVCQSLKQAGKAVSAFGVDISKDALRVAGACPSAVDNTLRLAVASVYRMPVADESCDLVLNLFAPLSLSEYRRVVRKNGCLLMVVPDTRHLWELKEVLYDIPYENMVQDTALDGFTMLTQQSVARPCHITDETQINALFGMTPYVYRTPENGRKRLFALKELTVTAAFRVFLYRKD